MLLNFVYIRSCSLSMNVVCCVFIAIKSSESSLHCSCSECRSVHRHTLPKNQEIFPQQESQPVWLLWIPVLPCPCSFAVSQGCRWTLQMVSVPKLRPCVDPEFHCLNNRWGDCTLGLSSSWNGDLSCFCCEPEKQLLWHVCRKLHLFRLHNYSSSIIKKKCPPNRRSSLGSTSGVLYLFNPNTSTHSVVVVFIVLPLQIPSFIFDFSKMRSALWCSHCLCSHQVWERVACAVSSLRLRLCGFHRCYQSDNLFFRIKNLEEIRYFLFSFITKISTGEENTVFMFNWTWDTL